ncbi:MAG: integrase, partial [Sporichthyaceae bacterium]|nr:integrase [Sporichthyaceae bacterium]
MHGLLDWEAAEIVRLFDEWAEVDRSTASSPTVAPTWSGCGSRRPACAACWLVRPPAAALPRPGRSVRQPFPDWVTSQPGSIWIDDTTHVTRAGVAATVIEELVSRKWLPEIVAAEETSTQLQVVFTQALEREGLLELVGARQDGLVDTGVDDPSRPVLLALSDNGPQMTSGTLPRVHGPVGHPPALRPPRHPTDQAWIESLFGHLKAEWPHLLAIG